MKQLIEQFRKSLDLGDAVACSKAFMDLGENDEFMSQGDPLHDKSLMSVVANVLKTVNKKAEYGILVELKDQGIIHGTGACDDMSVWTVCIDVLTSKGVLVIAHAIGSNISVCMMKLSDSKNPQNNQALKQMIKEAKNKELLGKFSEN